MRFPLFSRLLRAVAATTVSLSFASPVAAQPGGPIPRIEAPSRAAASWTSFRTEHFDVYSRSESSDWARVVAQRLESVRLAVAEVVGHAPSARVTVLVDDPENASNGNAISWLDAPQIALYPVPPGARSQIGRTRDWGELLAVHEFAHVAHLARESRSGGGLFSWMPGRFGPLSNSPRWVKEGYATVVEGQLTGSGRPSSPLRAAVLREWAVSGLLPSYGAINGSGSFQGGTFAYLMGSAFLERLQAEYGDSTLSNLWRRSSARTRRSFNSAFSATFGEQAPVLYSRYLAQLTANAVQLERALDAAPDGQGRVEGRLEVVLSRGSGDPAVSPDGRQLAISLPGGNGRLGRVVVWSTDSTGDQRSRLGANASAADSAAADSITAARDSARRAAAERRARRDPDDRPSVPQKPRGRRALYTLNATGGASYARPRWMPDGKRLLVVRADFTTDGSVRPDLYEWTPASGEVRRVTNGASVQDADPLPDGQHAVGTRCLNGHCDLVRIDLATGIVRTLTAGDAFTQYSRPRAIPNSVNIVANVQLRGRWRPMLVHARSGVVTPVDNPSAAEPTWDRYDVTATRDGGALLYVSEESGVPQLVRHELERQPLESQQLASQQLASQQPRPVSRVFSAAMAPEPVPGDSALLYLLLDARGYELRRLPLTPAGIAPTSSVLASRFVAAGADAVVRRQPRDAGVTFDVGPVTQGGYGLGSPRTVMLPIGGTSSDGGMAGGMLQRTDPIGRFGWMLMGLYSYDVLAERGGAARVRARLPWVTVDVDAVANQLGYSGNTALGVRAEVQGVRTQPYLMNDVLRWRGASASAAVARRDLRGMSGLRVGLAAHDVRTATQFVSGEAQPGGELVLGNALRSAPRWHGFVEGEHTIAVRRGPMRLAMDVRAHVSQSRFTLQPFSLSEGPAMENAVGPDAWAFRQLLQADANATLFGPVAFTYSGLVGSVNAASPYEQFSVGGMPSLLMSGSVAPQRVPVPWLPAGTLQGRDVMVHIVRVPTPVGLTPFASAARSGSPWHRAAGVSGDVSLPPNPFYRFPGMTATGGVAYLFDAADDRRVRAWAGVRFRP